MENTLSPELITMIRREIAASLHCALPGIVESFDPDFQTVDVRPALRSRLPDGSQVQFPLVRNVPIFYPGSRSAAMTYPVAAGDECLLIFADSAIDG